MLKTLLAALLLSLAGGALAQTPALSNVAKLRDIYVVTDPAYAGGAKCDGATDDSTAVQAAATAAAGKTLMIPAGRTCIVKNISVPANTRVWNQGTLKLKTLAALDGSPILVVAGDNVEVDGGILDGNKAAQPADGYSDSYNSGANGTGRRYRAAIVGESRTGVYVHDVLIKNTYGAGLALSQSSHTRFINNDCQSLKFECFYVAQTGAEVDAVISNNRIKDTASGDATVNGNAILVGPMSRVVITGNDIFNTERDGVKSEGANYLTITGNVIRTNTSDNFPAINVQAGASSDVVITGNVMSNVGACILLTAPTLTGFNVSGNVCDTTTGTGAADALQINGGTSVTDGVVSGNVFRNIKREGIYFPNSASRIKIIGNTLHGQAGSGQQALILGGTGTSDNVHVENNLMMNFAHDAVNDGVISSASISGGGNFTNFIFRGNTVLAGGSTNRAIHFGYSTNTISGIFDNNYIDGIILGPQTGLKLGVGNVVTGTNGLNALSCSNNCGTTSSVAGNDRAMIVTLGSGGVPASPFTVTFNATWPAAPTCIAQSALAGMVAGKAPIISATTTTTVVVTTNGTAPANSDKYAIHCFATQ